MATPQLSPGVLIREVDLTVGRADNVLDNIGVMAGPFTQGPVDEPVDIPTEKDLLEVFGKPLTLDNQYEYWMSASSFLSYGGVMKIVRTDSDYLVNANAKRTRTGEISGVDTNNIVYSINSTTGFGTTVGGSFTITSALYSTSGVGADARFLVSTASTDGTSNAIVNTVTILSGGVGFTTSDTVTISGLNLGGVGVGTTNNITLNITDIYSTDGISTVGQVNLKIKNFDQYEAQIAPLDKQFIFAAKTPGSWANNLKVCFIDDKADQTISVGTTVAQALTARADNGVGLGVTVALVNQVIPGTGSTSVFNGYLKAIITGVQDDAIDVKILGRVSAGSSVTEYVSYKIRNQAASIRPGNVIRIIDDTNTQVAIHTVSSSGTAVKDWYDQQKLDLVNGDIYWRAIAPKPGTSQYVAQRNGRSDEIHIVVVDDTGDVTGVQGNLLEKHIGLSKAKDAISAVNSPQKIWWKDYVARYSKYIYVGDNPSDNSNNELVYATGFSEYFTPYSPVEGLWDIEAQDRVYSALGNAAYTLTGGNDYSADSPGEIGSMTATLGDLITSYNLFLGK
jgi:hypothetical protein